VLVVHPPDIVLVNQVEILATGDDDPVGRTARGEETIDDRPAEKSCPARDEQSLL